MTGQDPLGFGGCKGLLWIVIGVVLAGSGLFLTFREFQYRSQSRLADAVVGYTWTDPRGRYSSGGPRSYYDFTVAGTPYWGKAGGLSPGRHVQIKYLPGNPSVNQLAGADQGFAGALVLIAGGVAFAAVGGFMISRSSDMTKDF